MDANGSASVRWMLTLMSGMFFLVLNTIGVWIARREAFKVNAVELSAWWYAFAVIAPCLAIATAICFPRTHPAWNRGGLTTVLPTLQLMSLVHVPVLYVLGGFK